MGLIVILLRVLPYLGLLLALTPVLRADPDEDYNPDFPFRPHNVSGLTSLYYRVGSYYNSTTHLEFTPLYGRTASDRPCENVEGEVFTHEFRSILNVAERGPYSVGQNPINMYLTLWEPGADFSTFSPSYVPDIFTNSAFKWRVESSPWSYQETNTSIDSFKGPEDLFNLTLAPTSHAPYNLTGEVVGLHTLRGFDMTLAACNTSREQDLFVINLIDGNWSGTAGWNWSYPQVDLQFDARSANLSIDGAFLALPFLRKNSSEDPRVPFLAPLEDRVQGKAKIRFSGVIDQYHSDVLVNDTSTPTWLRTVGFQNNSANIGYDSAASACLQAPPRAWAAAVLTVSLLDGGMLV